jgi:hypothetical protein
MKDLQSVSSTMASTIMGMKESSFKSTKNMLSTTFSTVLTPVLSEETRSSASNSSYSVLPRPAHVRFEW